MLTLNKKAVSLIVAYVLLISISLTLSGIIYAWLKWRVEPVENAKCEDATSLIIKSYTYDCENDELELEVQNKGLFSIDGFVVRVSDRVGGTMGIYLWEDEENELKPGKSVGVSGSSIEYITGATFGTIAKPLTFAEVQAYVSEKGEKIFCRGISTQALECS